jgi:hypothetical protein
MNNNNENVKDIENVDTESVDTENKVEDTIETDEELVKEFCENVSFEDISDFIGITVESEEGLLKLIESRYGNSNDTQIELFSNLPKVEVYIYINRCSECDVIMLTDDSGECLCSDGETRYESFPDEGSFNFESGSVLCNWCMEHEQEDAVHISKYENGEVSTGYIGDNVAYLEEFDDDEVTELVVSKNWVSTDAWRGFYNVKCNPDYVAVDDGWFCPMDGYGDSDYKVEDTSEFLKSGKCTVPVYVLTARTSNVCSTVFNMIVHKDNVEKFKSEIKLYFEPQGKYQELQKAV